MNADFATAPSDLVATHQGADVDRPERADSAWYAGERYMANANDAARARKLAEEREESARQRRAA